MKYKILGWLLIPVLLWLIPLKEVSQLQSTCIFKNITEFGCYGCGITRAVISAIQFQWSDAYEYNQLIVIVFPLLSFVWIRYLVKQISLANKN